MLPPASDSAPAPGKPTVITLKWFTLFNVTWLAQDIEVPWVMVLEDLWGTAGYLRLKAAGLWTPLTGLEDCSPDGVAGQPFPEDRLVLTDCPVGALIGRIGGSSAAVKATAPVTDAGESKKPRKGSYFLSFLENLPAIELDKLRPKGRLLLLHRSACDVGNCIPAHNPLPVNCRPLKD